VGAAAIASLALSSQETTWKHDRGDKSLPPAPLLQLEEYALHHKFSFSND
jgi:hypothetical protein